MTQLQYKGMDTQMRLAHDAIILTTKYYCLYTVNLSA